MASPLEDLDELTLKCRDEKARLHISEAVASYRAGAFRSAIVATWIAVCFDVIEKFRELALAGDVEALKQVEEIELARRTDDLSRALKFERELLGLARDKFELVSHLETIDLERLQADRNRCAHPSLSSEEHAYAPSAELARLHIHSAVTHLLQHPPVQGKYALDRLLKEIDSEYFPITQKDAQSFFASGPLRRPRESLIRSLVIVLCKEMLTKKPSWKRSRRIVAAILAVRQTHPDQVGKCFSEKLSSLVRKTEDKDLTAVIGLLESVSDTWQYFDEDVRQRLQNYVGALPAADFMELEFLLKFHPLQAQAKTRVRYATRKDLSQGPLLFFELPSEVADRFIVILLESRSFEDANEWAKEISLHFGDFTAEHVRRILTSVGGNVEIMGSFRIGPMISTLREHKKLSEGEFEKLLDENGLSKFAIGAVK